MLRAHDLLLTLVFIKLLNRYNFFLILFSAYNACFSCLIFNYLLICKILSYSFICILFLNLCIYYMLMSNGFPLYF